MSKTDIIVVEAVRAEEMPHIEDPSEPAVGRWFWWTDPDDNEKLMGCVTHLGSNYAKIKFVDKRSARILYSDWHDECNLIEDPDSIIDGKLTEKHLEVHELMAEIKAVTARLAIVSGPELTAKPEVQSLALHISQPMDEYKTALIRAQTETLPELFNKIREKHEQLAMWMGAKLIPMKAEAAALEPAMDAIKTRIFNVELYAGLVETVTQVKDGEPANLTDKIHLMQRRAYMDEECLARYKVGGMELRDIGAFDRWLSDPENFTRLLPHPRTMLAFRVRRDVKYRHISSYISLQIAQQGARDDMRTFLYFRNGEQLFRLSTKIEFDAKLFPDMSQDKLGQKLWAKMSCGKIEDLITDNEYQGILDERAERKKLYDAANDKDKWNYTDYSHDTYEPFEPSSVYYDDISAKVQEEMAEHNRLVLVLQGLLDRSPVFHPHPPWSLWHHESFQQALALVYDSSRTLTVGDAPDFEAYRKRLNASIKEGSITIGQERAWKNQWEEKETKPHYNDPGPGYLAEVDESKARGKKCMYSWERSRRTPGDPYEDAAPKGPIRCTVTVSTEELFNVSAYTPGDFRQFFDDPRARADYLEWAPLLLEAEEYHAGNRKVKGVVPKAPKKEPNWKNQQAYQLRKEIKALNGKAVRFEHRIRTRSGLVYEAGSLWRAFKDGSKLRVVGILPDGSRELNENNMLVRWMSGITVDDVYLDSNIPDQPKSAPITDDEEESK